MKSSKVSSVALICAVAFVVMELGRSQAAAQEAIAVPASAQARSSRSARMLEAKARAQAAKAQAAQAANKPAEKKPADDSKKPDDKSGDKKPEGGTPDTITRPNDPDTPPDPSELELRPNADGKLRLNFTGQPWPDVLEWLKKVSNLTLDWQELPGGYLNLVTHREYTVEEARSLINRHLLARGYTIVINGELMTVEKIEKLNPAVVPRVTAESLDSRDPYEFVKVSFKLEGMLAEDAATEFEPMKSPNGKLTALSSSNCLEAMDAVINLRDIRDAVLAMQTVPEEEQLVRPFYLEHVRAQDIVNPLRELLGLPPVATGGRGGGGGGFNPGQMQQVVQQMQQMVQQMQQAAQQNKGGGKAGPRSRRQEKIYIVPVERDNAVLVSGPPNKMALVENAIEILDQPAVGPSSALNSIAETEVFRLAKLNPETFETMLREMGGLSPYTKVQVDKARRIVIVTGPRTDRMIVQLMIEKLDGSSRSFHVIALRKHQADYVAGSIRFMMGIEEESESGSSSRRGFFYYPYGSSRQEEEDPSDKFKVDADVEYNRLLLWCNNVELEQVRNLLIELGELPMPGGNQNRRRVYELDSVEDALNLIERIQKAWPSRGQNPLDVVEPPVEPKPESEPVPSGPVAPDKLEIEPVDKTASDRERNKPESKSDGRVARNSVTTIPAHLRRAQLLGLLAVSQLQDSPSATPADDSGTEAPPAAEESEAVPPKAEPAPPAVTPMPLEADDPAARFQRLLEELKRKREAEIGATGSGQSGAPTGSAPIQVRIGANGEIFIESNDTYALDMLEEMIEEYSPPRRDWKVFELKYPNTWAYGIEVILKDIFKEEMEEDDGRSGGSGYRYDPWFGLYRSRSSGGSGPRRMSQRKPLKIISDRDTHTILVQGATREQLHTIEELIAVYDKPESTEDHAIRQTQVFKIKYSTAKVIADAIKEVYRDLLSENDKALQQEGRGNKEQRPVERSYTYIYGGGGEG